jgi:hypothetical protein
MARKKKTEQSASEALAPRKRGRRKKAEAPPATEPGAPQLPAPAAAEKSSETPPEAAGAGLPEVLRHAPGPALREGPVTPPARPVQSPDLAEAERKLTERYPNVTVEVGSLRPGAAEGWGTKRVVTIRCAACDRPRTVATSDLHHVRHCEECADAARKAARRDKRREQ